MKRIYKYISRYKIYVIIPFIAMLVSMILDMFNPYLKKIMIDKVLVNGEINLLGKVLISLGIITGLRSILGYIKEFLFDYMSTKVNRDIKRDLFHHIQLLPYKYFDGMNTGELMSRMSEDIDNIWRAVGFGTAIFIENALYFVTATAILFYINWKLTIISLITMPLIGIAAMKLEKKISAAFEEISDQAAVINTTAQENIAGVRLVKAFAREKHETLKFLEMNQMNYKLNMKQTGIWGKYFPLIEFLSNISVVMVVSLGGLFVINEKMSIGTLVAFNEYLWMLIWPMRMLGWLTNLMGQAKASIKKIYKIMDTQPEIVDKEDAIELPKVEGRITFENVSLKYENEYVLKNINLDVKPHTTVAIMGTTGSGKTSIINLIGRYYDVSEGRVLVDGIDVREIRIKDLRRKMAVVAQDTFLFSDSIEENVRFGNEYASRDEIKKACSDACVDEFISELEDGYDTIIGERGIGLSGGQKQRISIARALVRDAEIMIFDDATSALDMETEYKLLKNIYNKDKMATTFIIAHRISAVKNADEIIFLENGKIVERGTHEELLNKRGKYFEVYSEQFKDFDDMECEVI